MVLEAANWEKVQEIIYYSVAAGSGDCSVLFPHPFFIAKWKSSKVNERGKNKGK
jgi:hypothetical protein